MKVSEVLLTAVQRIPIIRNNMERKKKKVMQVSQGQLQEG